MTAPASVTLTLAPDTRVYPVMTGIKVSGAGGEVLFVPPPDMTPLDRLTIYAQWIEALNEARELALDEWGRS